MPSLSINYNPQVGPIIQATILKSGHNIESQSGPVTPTLYAALIDSGASCTGISQKVITALQLQPVGKQPVGGVHGLQPTNLYQFDVGIIFPAGAPTAAGLTQANLVAFSVQGTAFVPGQAPFDVLLGRDVLCRGVFSMSFDGHAIFSL